MWLFTRLAKIRQAAAFLLLLFSIFTCYFSAIAQGRNTMQGKDKYTILPEIYSLQVLESFEDLELKKENLQFRGGQKAEIMWLKAYPAPVVQSKRYLAFMLHGRGNEGASIAFDQPYSITDYCESFHIWVYGTDLPGVLSIMVQDARTNIHVLNFGRLKFRGWRRLTVMVPDHVVQARLTINRPVNIKVLKILYSPGPVDRLKSWQVVYLDHFTARTRKKLLMPGG